MGKSSVDILCRSHKQCKKCSNIGDNRDSINIHYTDTQVEPLSSMRYKKFADVGKFNGRENEKY